MIWQQQQQQQRHSANSRYSSKKGEQLELVTRVAREKTLHCKQHDRAVQQP
jgi:hypothetical protein